MQRSITPYIKKDLPHKIVFVTGPRQVGKTFLSKHLYQSFDYFSYDSADHRLLLNKLAWDRKKELIVFDEIHKMRAWKRWLKGIFDTEGIATKILVTGSAQLNTYRKVGDSLAGRYFQFRLYPFDLKEAKQHFTLQDAFSRLWNCSGFPEPFLNGDVEFYNRWKKTHLDIILRQDLIDLQVIKDIKAIETLIELLKNQVGSTISYLSLGRLLEKDAKTIKRWLQLLEELYIIYKVTPFSNKITRSILKEPKYYFYDHAQVTFSDGAKLENLVATTLLKELHFCEDTKGWTTQLHFLKKRDGKEIDILIVINKKPVCLIEVKMNDASPSKNFESFADFFPSDVKKVQLVNNLSRETTYPNGIEIKNLITWLSEINFAHWGA